MSNTLGAEVADRGPSALETHASFLSHLAEQAGVIERRLEKTIERLSGPESQPVPEKIAELEAKRPLLETLENRASRIRTKLEIIEDLISRLENLI